MDYEIRKQNRAEVQNEIERLAASGLTADQIGEVNLTRLEKMAGYTPGSLRAQFDATVAAQQIKSEADLAAAQTKIVDLLTKIPSDQTITIGGSTYNGLKEVDRTKGLYSFTETDSRGQVTQVVTRYNPNTGRMEIVDKLNFGTVGKPMKGSSGGGGSKSSGSAESYSNVSGGGSSSLLGINTTQGKTLDKLLTNYPSDFKYYMKEIAPSVRFQLTQSTIAQMFQQFQDLKRKGVAPFGGKVGVNLGNTSSSNNNDEDLF